MDIYKVSTHTIIPQEDGSLRLENGDPFDAEAYSLMKYGDSRSAQIYGSELGQTLIDEVTDSVSGDRAVFTVPAFTYAPKPALAIARAALTHVNEYRTSKGLEPARMMRMHTDQMGTTAYAQSSLEMREAEVKKWPTQHHIPASLVEDAIVFAVDDCVITGATEKKLINRLSAYNPGTIVCAYALKVDPEKALEFPGIEHVLNVAAKPDLGTVLELINERHFTLNSRVLDMILDTEDIDELNTFLRDCPQDIRADMYEATINSSLEFIGRYPDAIALLSRYVYAAVTN